MLLEQDSTAVMPVEELVPAFLLWTLQGARLKVPPVFIRRCPVSLVFLLIFIQLVPGALDCIWNPAGDPRSHQ